jgi:hypothetical protein
VISSTRRSLPFLVILLAFVLSYGATRQAPASAAPAAQNAAARAIPRTPSGRPNLHGIWQVRNRAAYGLEYHNASAGILPGKGVVMDDGVIPYKAEALATRNANYDKRAELDPFNQCFMPGVPRIMYLEHPFQIFQTDEHVSMVFEWSQVFRLIYTDGSKHTDGIEFFMGDARGRWEGDTLVVDVANFNDRTWLDAAGNFHSEQLKLTERYNMLDADTIQYEVTIEDPKVFTRPWKISMPLHRHKDMDRLLEYQCQAEKEEANGAFPREERTWYPKPKP